MSKVSEQPLTETPRRLLGRSQITGGNLRNNHFYVREFFDKFPADAIGGSNKKTAASRDITVDWGGPSLVLTDIDKTKGFLASAAGYGSSFRLQVHVKATRSW
ncbi:hypothetical protein LAL4801_00677 [Roseibium aggregatum]|uniref:Uncharacterized protein n=1 Tax=Roseibium aggregatum TaxID=187304 RepID=A0A0M6XY68_9HYPH|nr:hypothetical protein LAL4801_00677 [Roseibium aggregatum]